MDNFYGDPSVVNDRIGSGKHRKLVGGMWEELGQLQLDFLIAQGLRPEHVLIDIGCGALRGGMKFIPYLDPGHYWGIDSNELLLQTGWDLEVQRYRLADRQPRDQLVCLADFEFDTLGVQFDMAIAQSLFTHLSFNRIRRCLARLAPSLKPGATLYATFYELGEDEDREAVKMHGERGVPSYSDKSFYHYTVRDFRYAAEGLPYAVDYIGEWQHPRAQRMIAFERTGAPD